MAFYRQERLALFIDGANLYHAARALSFDIDYRLLLDWAQNRGRMVRAYYTLPSAKIRNIPRCAR